MPKIMTRLHRGGILLLVVACVCTMSVVSAQTDKGIEFPGTVLSVDVTAGKFAVKKDGGGTRFTFATNNATKFQGTGLAALKDLQRDDKVVVLYHVLGSQYLAISVTKR